MNLLENKTALITGGSRGIGATIVTKFAEAGAKVAFTYLGSEERANTLVSELNGKGYDVKCYKSNAASFSEAATLIDAVIKDFGKIDILVNNAGITRDNLLLRMTEEQWDEVLQTNLKSAFNLTKHAIRHMLSKRTGSIINLSSVVGVFGNAGQANYSASKAGLIGFSKSVAKELGSRNVRCNVIAPGYIATEMTHGLDDKVKESFMSSIPLHRMGETEDVANACIFLGSDLSSYVTGQVISVCGGLSM